MKVIEKKMVAKNNKIDKLLKKVGAWLQNKKNRVSAWLGYLTLNVVTSPLMTSASDPVQEDTTGWNTVMNYVLKWVPRIGGVLLFLGAIEFAIAYKNEDANSKTNATRLMLSGAMVIGIPLALKGLILI